MKPTVGTRVLLSFLLALAGAAHGSAAPERTVLTGRVLDPVTDAPVAGAIIRLGNATATTDARGTFTVRIGKRKAPQLATSFEATGFRTYRTWTPTGSETERDVYLFPDRDVSIPGIPGHDGERVLREKLEQQFNVLYRDEFQVGGTLTRWMRQPDIYIVDHLIEWRDNRIYATDQRTPTRVIRRLKKAIRDSIGPLTNGFLHGDDIRRRRVQPGEMLREGLYGYVPGELPVYVFANNQSGGIGFVEDQEIVAGALFMFDEVFLRPADEYSPLLLLHEFGHVLGMYHPHFWPNEYPLGTPLCSVVSQIECERGKVVGAPTPIDLVTARLAYSRLPGNDRNDADPMPAGR